MPGPFYQKEGLSSAVYERGNSFIQATELILAHSHSDIEMLENKKTNENIKKLSYDLKKLKNYWDTFKNDKSITLETLAQLEKILIQEIRETIYKDTDPPPSFEKIKDELDNAENHVNWKPRELFTTHANPNANISTCRIETPISHFTNEQTEEWLHILSFQEENQPLWFKSLALWEKNYLRKRINDWRKNSEYKNLGDFLGPVPTTIRRYPGTPNAYVTSVTIGKEEFLKIRSGFLVPIKMTAQNQVEKDEKIKITKQNLEQLILAAIDEKLKALEKQKDTMPLKKPSLPILLQTLHSSPFQPPGTYNNVAIMRALDELKTELSHSPNSFMLFLEKHNKDPNKIPFSGINLFYSNRPVNKVRNLTWITNLFSLQGRKSRDANKALKSLAKEKLKEKDDPLLREALKSYKKMPYFWNTILAGEPSKNNNSMAEIAALEQIIASRLGMRIGCCVSGKDREEMVTQIAIAQQEFFVTYGKFPPPYTATSTDDKKMRKVFIENVARAYLTGHGQFLAGENARGCDGLKNITDVFGKEICNEIIKHVPINGFDPKNFNPIKTSQKVASLNKLTLERLKKVSIATFKAKWHEHENKSSVSDNIKIATKEGRQLYTPHQQNTSAVQAQSTQSSKTSPSKLKK